VKCFSGERTFEVRVISKEMNAHHQHRIQFSIERQSKYPVYPMYNWWTAGAVFVSRLDPEVNNKVYRPWFSRCAIHHPSFVEGSLVLVQVLETTCPNPNCGVVVCNITDLQENGLAVVSSAFRIFKDSNPVDREFMRAMKMMPNRPFDEDLVMKYWLHYLIQTKQIYDPSRGLTINAGEDFWSKGNQELSEMRANDPNSGFFFDAKEGDPIFHKWYYQGGEGQTHYVIPLNERGEKDYSRAHLENRPIVGATVPNIVSTPKRSREKPTLLSQDSPPKVDKVISRSASPATKSHRKSHSPKRSNSTKGKSRNRAVTPKKSVSINLSNNTWNDSWNDSWDDFPVPNESLYAPVQSTVNHTPAPTTTPPSSNAAVPVAPIVVAATPVTSASSDSSMKRSDQFRHLVEASGDSVLSIFKTWLLDHDVNPMQYLNSPMHQEHFKMFSMEQKFAIIELWKSQGYLIRFSDENATCMLNIKLPNKSPVASDTATVASISSISSDGSTLDMAYWEKITPVQYLSNVDNVQDKLVKAGPNVFYKVLRRFETDYPQYKCEGDLYKHCVIRITDAPPKPIQLPDNPPIQAKPPSIESTSHYIHPPEPIASYAMPERYSDGRYAPHPSLANGMNRFDDRANEAYYPYINNTRDLDDYEVYDDAHSASTHSSSTRRQNEGYPPHARGNYNYGRIRHSQSDYGNRSQPPQYRPMHNRHNNGRFNYNQGHRQNNNFY
jgi:hypothetical protein